VLANRHRLFPRLEDLDRVTIGQRDDRALLIAALSLGETAPLHLAVPVEVARTLPERLQRVMGYFVHEPNLGSLEGQDPIGLLTGDLAVNGHFREFLPEEVRPLLAEHRAKLKAA
jgi:hypothetical protein